MALLELIIIGITTGVLPCASWYLANEPIVVILARNAHPLAWVARDICEESGIARPYIPNRSYTIVAHSLVAVTPRRAALEGDRLTPAENHHAFGRQLLLSNFRDPSAERSSLAGREMSDGSTIVELRPLRIRMSCTAQRRCGKEERHSQKCAHIHECRSADAVMTG